MKLMLTLALLAATPAFAADSRALYEEIPGEGLAVEFSVNGDPVVGMQVFEKRSEKLVCQKSAPVVPNPQYSYRCFEVKAEGKDAADTYRSASAEEMSVKYLVNGQPRVGGFTNQKAEGEGFCREEGEGTDPSEFRYACYAPVL